MGGGQEEGDAFSCTAVAVQRGKAYDFRSLFLDVAV
jgi:hypothetical protein